MTFRVWMILILKVYQNGDFLDYVIIVVLEMEQLRCATFPDAENVYMLPAGCEKNSKEEQNPILLYFAKTTYLCALTTMKR